MTSRVTDVALGLAVAAAFSPGLADLVVHWMAHPWSRYSAIFVLLLVWVARREGAVPAHRALGVAGLALGAVLPLRRAALQLGHKRRRRRHPPCGPVQPRCGPVQPAKGASRQRGDLSH